jgi:serine/threonine protein kinase
LTIKTNDGPITLDVPDDCTVGAFIDLFAAQLSVGPAQFSLLLSNKPVTDPDQCVFSLSEQLFLQATPTVSRPPAMRDFSGMSEVRRLGSVTLVEDPETHELVALKAVAKELETPLIHPCVVEVVGYADGVPRRIAMRFPKPGSLQDALNRRGPGDCMDGTAVTIVVCGIVLGMQFLHARQVAHGGLKPANVLLDERGFPRVGDIAAPSRDDGYSAPELYPDGKATPPGDVYSFSLILYELVVGERVFPAEMTPAKLIQQAMSGMRPVLRRSMNSTVKDIITRCWSAEPISRYSFTEIWARLKSTKFQFTSNVNLSRVSEFIAWVRMNEEQVGPANVPSDV